MKIYSARETELMRELDGLELAAFWQRAVALVIDLVLASILYSLLATLAFYLWQHIPASLERSVPAEYHLPVAKELVLSNGHRVRVLDVGGNEAIHFLTTVIVPILYFGILLWSGKGRTPGKRLLSIRVVSLAHRQISFWHAVERALGYGAAALELGFGFLQFFIHPYRRCAQDRLAETIVTEQSYQSLQSILR